MFINNRNIHSVNQPPLQRCMCTTLQW